MKLRKLVEIMNVEDIVQFRFVPLDVDPRPSFHFISNEKWNAYRNSTIEQRDLITSEDDLFIYIPDVTEKELYSYIMQIGPQYAYDALKQISFIFNFTNEERDLVYAIYTILHETGHYVFYKNSHMTSIEYGDWELEFRIPALVFNEYLKSLPNDSDRIMYMPRLFEMYKAIPSEIEADKYAFSIIADKYELVRSTLEGPIN